MTTEEQKQARDAWDKIAAGFDEFTTPTNMAFALTQVSQPVPSS